MIILLHFVQSFLSIGLPRSIVILQDVFVFLSIGLPRSIGRTKFFLQLTNNLLGNGLPRFFFNGFRELGWLGRIRLKYLSTRLLNEFSYWLLFNCRAQFIIPSGPIEIGFQRDLRWWTRRQVLSFIQFSPFLNLSAFTMQFAGSVL